MIVKCKVLGKFRQQKFEFIFIKDDKHFWTYPRCLRDWVWGFVGKNEIKRDGGKSLYEDMASEKVTQKVPKSKIPDADNDVNYLLPFLYCVEKDLSLNQDLHVSYIPQPS